MERTRRFGNHIETAGYREKLPHLVKRQANCSHARRRRDGCLKLATNRAAFYLASSRFRRPPDRFVRSAPANRSSLTLRVKHSGIAAFSSFSFSGPLSQSRHDAVGSRVYSANEPRADTQFRAQKRSCHESEDDPSLHPRPRPGRVARVLRTRAGPGRSEAHGARRRIGKRLRHNARPISRWNRTVASDFTTTADATRTWPSRWTTWPRAFARRYFVNERMGIYFIEDPDGCWLEILPADRAE